MKKHESREAYKKITVAVHAAHTVVEILDLISGGYGIELPEDMRKFAASTHLWLMAQQEQLEDDLGVASTHDQYGRLVLKAGQRFVLHPDEGADRFFTLLKVYETHVIMQFDGSLPDSVPPEKLWQYLQDGTIEQAKE